MKNKLLIILTALCTLFLFSGCDREFHGNFDLPSWDNSGNKTESSVISTDFPGETNQSADEILPEETSADELSSETTSSEKETGILKVHFLDVGQGDSTFIELPDGKTMLIDAGGKDTADKITTYIFEQGYNSLNYVVATHDHDDHIGGMPEVLSNFNVGDFYTTEYACSETHEKSVTAAENSGGSVHYVKPGDEIFGSDNLSAEIAAPKEYDEKNVNNNSIVFRLTFGENRFLFTGDAEKTEEDGIWTNIKCDVLKIGHHGSDTSSSKNFLKKAEPSYAVISVGSGNSYGHPSPDVLKRLNQRNISIFRTDIQGTVVFTSDGKTLSYSINPWEYTEPAQSTSEKPQTDTAETSAESSDFYVLNTNSKRIHSPDCSAVKDIKDKNKAFTDDYDEAVSEGYKPCGICHAGH